MAATPTAMQTKKNSSRRHDARVSRTAMPEDEPHRDAAPTDAAVAQDEPRIGHRRQLGVVRHEHERRAARRVDVAQQLHDVAAVGAVEVAGRLVGQHDRRIVGQRARERHALLLAARELRRVVMRAAGQPDFLEQRSARAPRVGDAGDLHRHGDVLVRGQRRDEVEELEDEPDLLAAQPRERVLVEPRDVDAVDEHVAGRRRVEAGDQAEQRGLAAARRPDDRHELAARRSCSVSGCRMVSGSVPLVTVFETSRSSIMTGVAACSDDRLEHGPDVVGDDPRAFGGGMDAVALIERVDRPPRPAAGTARARRDTARASAGYTWWNATM